MNPKLQTLVEQEILTKGDQVRVSWQVPAPGGTEKTRRFLVPRHWISLHGANLDEVVAMGFEEIK